MPYKDKDKAKEHSKQYYIENKDKMKAYKKQHYIKNKEKLKEYSKQHYIENRDKNKQYRIKNKDKSKQYNIKNKNKIKKQRIKCCRNKMRFWIDIIPSVTNCQICNKKIYYGQENKKNAIHFDHKNENVPIKLAPSVWLQNHKRTLEDEKIWKSCDFGMLCCRCNLYLPTKNRRQFIMNVIKYVFGNNARTQLAIKILKEEK